MRKYFATLLLLFSVNALATDTFDATTSILNIDAVILNGVKYNNVVIQLTGFNLISIGSYAPVTVSATCSTAFSIAQYNAITVGMTMGQVEQVLGCQYTPSGTYTVGNNAVANTWEYSNFSVTPAVFEQITVYFDVTDSVATAYGGQILKSRIGF